MRFRGKIFILTTAVLLLMAVFVSSSLAADTPGQAPQTTTRTWVNPIYADIVTDHPTAQSMQAMDVTEPVPVATMDALRDLLTQGFANRETSLSIVYTGAFIDLSNEDNTLNNLDAMLDSIIKGDDYLYFNLQSWGYGGSGSDGNFQIDFNVAYMTTLVQEDYVDAQVDTILANLIAPHMNQHQKVKAIHDYIVLYVAYDETYTKYSAYAALYDGQAACQGYALLAYKMLTEAGFEARIVSGDAGNDIDGRVAHAWNRVKLDGLWYNLDCTWDDPVPDVAGKVNYNYYHLTDTELAVDHQRDEKYNNLLATDVLYLPEADDSYFDTLNGKIRDSIDANEMDQTTLYLSLRQKLGLEYLFDEKTADSRTLSLYTSEAETVRKRYLSSSIF